MIGKPSKHSSRRKGAWAIGRIAAEVTGKAFERHGLGRGEIAHAWPYIAGRDLARICRPLRIAPSRGRREGGILLVEAAHAHTVDVHYAAARIVDGVNALYGQRVISQVKVQPLAGDGLPQSRDRRPAVAQPEDPERYTKQHGPALGRALARLEAGMLADKVSRIGARSKAMARDRNSTHFPGGGHALDEHVQPDPEPDDERT